MYGRLVYTLVLACCGSRLGVLGRLLLGAAAVLFQGGGFLVLHSFRTVRSWPMCTSLKRVALSVVVLCSASSACVGARACSPDYSLSSCPVGWADLGDNVCSGPSSYDGGCLRLVRMWDDDFKREFGICLVGSQGVPYTSRHATRSESMWCGLALFRALRRTVWVRFASASLLLLSSLLQMHYSCKAGVPQRESIRDFAVC